MQPVLENSSKEIISGIVINILLVAISLFIPVFAVICPFFIPLTVLFYRIKSGRHACFIVFFITIAVLWLFFSNFLFGLFFFGGLLLTGFLLGEFILLNMPVEKVVFYVCAAMSAAVIFCMMAFSLVTGNDIINLISEHIAKSLNEVINIYHDIGISQENIQFVEASFSKIQYILVSIMPAVFLCFEISISWVTILFARTLFKKKGLFFPEFGKLNCWKAPDYCVWFVIGCGLILFLPENGLKIVAFNVILILMVIYFLQGIAIISFYFEKKKVIRSLRFFLYFILAVQQIATILVVFFGFIDIWVDFRKLKAEE